MTDTREIRALARKVAAELVLLPTEMRGTTTYSEEYLKTAARCWEWRKLRCANCDCEKSGEEEAQ